MLLKKIILLFFAVLACVFTPTVFGAQDNPNSSIVIYYTINGNTKTIAQKISAMTNSEVFEIEKDKPYSDNYKKFTEQILKEAASKKCPKLKQKKLKDLYKYDVVYLGIPVYYGEIAPAMRTFLKANKFKGKTVIPFYSLDNGNLGNAAKSAKKLVGKTHFKNGFEYKSKDKSQLDSELASWLYSIK